MAANNDEAWSSGESEPEDEPEASDLEEEPMDVDSDDDDSDPNQIHEDEYFYPSIKEFTGTSEINPSIVFSGNSPIDYFKYFF